MASVFQFNPERKLSKDDRLYNGAPTLSDRVHVVVFVFDANTVQLIEGGVMETLQDVMKEAKDMGENRDDSDRQQDQGLTGHSVSSWQEFLRWPF